MTLKYGILSQSTAVFPQSVENVVNTRSCMKKIKNTRHIPWNRYNLEKYRDINFWSYRPALSVGGWGLLDRTPWSEWMRGFLCTECICMFKIGVRWSNIQDRYLFNIGIFCWIGVSVWRYQSKFDILHSYNCVIVKPHKSHWSRYII